MARDRNNTRPTLLLAWELGGGLGHLIRAVPLVKRFRQRGFRVVLAARDLSSVQSVFGELAVEFLQAPIKTSKPENRVKSPRSLAHILHNSGFGRLDELQALVAAWRNLFAMTGCDLLLCDHAPTALLAARGMGVKVATTGTGFCCPPDVYPLPDFRPWLPEATDQLRAHEDRLLENVNTVLRSNHVGPFERLGQLYGDVDECFLATFPELDHYPKRSDGEYRGAWPNAGGASPQWPNGPGKKVFAYLKMSRGLQEVLSQLNHLRLPTLVYIHRLDAQLRGQFQSSRLRFVDRPLDLARVGRQCDLAILNAGHGATVSMLLAGKPILQLPLNLEQTLTGLAIERMNAGLHVPPDGPTQAGSSLIRLVDSEQYAQGARRFADRYVDYDPERALDALVESAAALVEPTDSWAATGQRPKHAPVASPAVTSGQRPGLIIGLGTGRCGARSLATLLSRQPSTAVAHESKPLLPWERSSSDGDLPKRFGKLAARFPQVARIGDVACFYLPYAEEILDRFEEARFICLRRDRQETIDSFVRLLVKTRQGRPMNHWSADREGFDSDEWDAMFPKYPTRDMAQAIGLYWDEYYSWCERLIAAHSQRVRLFETNALNDPAAVREILTFAGVPPSQQILVSVHVHKSGQA